MEIKYKYKDKKSEVNKILNELISGVKLEKCDRLNIEDNYFARQIDSVYNKEGQIENVEIKNKKVFITVYDSDIRFINHLDMFGLNKQELQQYIEVLQKIEKQMEG